MDGEVGELSGVIVGTGGDGQGGVGLRMFSAGAFGVVIKPDGEQVGFDGADAVDAPSGVGQGLDQMSFGGALGPVFVVESLGEFEVGGEIESGQDDDLAGDGVAGGGEWVHCAGSFGSRNSRG